MSGPPEVPVSSWLLADMDQVRAGQDGSAGQDGVPFPQSGVQDTPHPQTPKDQHLSPHGTFRTKRKILRRGPSSGSLSLPC
jgi:hypothetical protein